MLLRCPSGAIPHNECSRSRHVSASLMAPRAFTQQATPAPLGPGSPPPESFTSVSVALPPEILQELRAERESHSRGAGGRAGETKSVEELYAKLSSAGEHLGPVQVHHIAGFGLGLSCIRQVEPGEILLTCRPLGPLLIHSDEHGHAPSIQSLLKLMTSSKYTRSEIKWIELLRHTKMMEYHADDVQELLQSSSIQSRSLPCPAVDTTTLEALVLRASHSKAYQDIALTQCLRKLSADGHNTVSAAAGSHGYGFTGIWPAYSLLHHSCVPNATVMVLGDTLVVRAAKRLKYNTLVRVTKIGDSVLTPMAERQAKLAKRHHYGCNCRRCRFESGLTPELKNLIRSVHVGCADLRPAVEKAIKEDDQAALDKAGAKLAIFRAKLQKLCGDDNLCLPPRDMAHTDSPLEESEAHQQPSRNPFGFFQLSPKERDWVEAPMYCLYDTYTEFFAVDDMDILMACVDVLSEVYPGSELHVATASKYLRAVRNLYSQGAMDEVLAQEMCMDAHVARYGAMTRSLMEELIQGATRGGKVTSLSAYDRISSHLDL